MQEQEDTHKQKETLEQKAQRDPDDSRIIDLAIRMLFLGIFVYSALLIVMPLAGVVVWAIILAAAIYPLHAWISRILGGREGLSATLLTLVGLGLTIGPLAASVTRLADAATKFGTKLAAGELKVPPPPPDVMDLPIVGKPIFEAWSLFERDTGAAMTEFGPLVVEYGGGFVGTLAGLGAGILGMALSVVVMGLLLKPGPKLADMLRRFGNRIFAPRGGEFVTLAGATVRNVSRGVLGVAALQAGLAGIVMSVFGVPAAGALALICLILGIIQIGPGLVILPVIIWAWTAMGAGQALLFTVLMVPIMLMDNILRPIFIARGLTTPMLVILVGVLGGMLAFGLIGIFIGPVILSVFYELVILWMARGEDPVVDEES